MSTEARAPIMPLYSIRLILLGDSGVGKTALLLRFADDLFSPVYLSTIGIDFKIRTMYLDHPEASQEGNEKIPVRVQLWDTAGQERFRSITAAYYRGATGILIVYDVTHPPSFHHVENWINSVQKSQDGTPRPIILVGNKCDLTRSVQRETAEALVKRYDLPYFEVSAKTGANVTESFSALANAAFRWQLASEHEFMACKNNETITRKEAKSNRCGCNY